MRTCFEFGGVNPYAAKPKSLITLEQAASGKFRVTYGLQVCDRLTYAEAAKDLGACIMHHLNNEGVLE